MNNRKLVVVNNSNLTAAALIRRIGIMAAIAGSLSACGAGYEATASLGYHRIDEIQSSQRTYKQPLKCLFVNCDQPSESQGS